MRSDDIISMLLVLGVLPITIILIVYYLQKAKIKERIRLLEKGVDITQLKQKESPFQNVLMWGMLSGGVGFGLLVGYIILEIGVARDDMILGILSLLFGGISLIIFYFINKRDSKS